MPDFLYGTPVAILVQIMRVERVGMFKLGLYIVVKSQNYQAYLCVSSVHP